REPADPYQAGGLFSLGKPGHITDLFVGVGFQNVATTVVSAPFTLSSARDYLDFIRSSASPIMQLLGSLTESEQAAAWAEMEDELTRFQTPAGWQGPNELLLTVGTR